MSKDKQVNIRMDADLVAIIDEMRAGIRPIPSAAEVIRTSVLFAAAAAGNPRAAKLLKDVHVQTSGGGRETGGG